MNGDALACGGSAVRAEWVSKESKGLARHCCYAYGGIFHYSVRFSNGKKLVTLLLSAGVGCSTYHHCCYVGRKTTRVKDYLSLTVCRQQPRLLRLLFWKERKSVRYRSSSACLCGWLPLPHCSKRQK
ncbi:unnamed protein product [Ectocarpus sp. 13 AM-2016]